MNHPFLQSLFIWFDNRLVALGMGAPPQDPQAKQQRIEELYQTYAQHFPDVVEISVPALMQLQQTQSVVLVDVRSPQEQAVSRLPGAITLAEFEQHRDRYCDRPIVAYCTIGYRSGLLAKDLQQQGIPVQNLRGSVLSWTHAGGHFVTPDGQPTQKVHVYGKRWNLIAADYHAIW
ncbi:MAG: rhodanese-like domain-containing protein [Leptolyngbyaceae cyanobacterium bins.349]|nr:rhodanese-like domain-containing protein [Leptolyngbyaceae cyanobacterium bins.349]